MRLDAVEVRVVELSLAEAVGTATGVHARRPVLLVRVVTEGTEGWGECAALAEGTSVDPPLAETHQAMCDSGVPRLLEACASRDGDLPPWAMVRLLYGSGVLANTLAAAIEMAVLDVELRVAGRSLVDQLGSDIGPVAVGAVLGIPADRQVATLVAQADGLVWAGYRRLRVKIAPGWDLAPLAALRERFGDLDLQADANASYRWSGDGPRDARQLCALDPLGLTCIEQPLPAADLTDLAALGQLLGTPICLDESLTSPERVRDAIRYGACAVACLKPARLGGLVAVRSALAHCAAAGVPAFMGGFFETGLARSANLALARLDGFSLPGDLSSPGDYLDEDPFGYPEVRQGIALPYAGPGIAPAPAEGPLEARTSRLTRFAPP